MCMYCDVTSDVEFDSNGNNMAMWVDGDKLVVSTAFADESFNICYCPMCGKEL